MKGARKSQIQKNESYYSGGGDKASVKTEAIQSALKELRKNIKGTSEENKAEIEKKKYYKYFVIGATFIAIATGITYYFLIYQKK